MKISTELKSLHKWDDFVFVLIPVIGFCHDKNDGFLSFHLMWLTVAFGVFFKTKDND